MRITPHMQNEALQGYLASHAARGDRLTRQIAAGKRILRPADAPTRTPELLRLQQALSETEGYLRQTQEASSWLAETDAVLGRATDLLVRVRELVVLASSSTQNESGLEGIAQEIGQIKEEMQSVANSRLGDRYLFSDGTEDWREICPDLTLQINIEGSELFSPPAEYGKGPGVFDLFNQILTHLDSPNPEEGQEQLRSHDLEDLNKVLDRFIAARASVGVKAQRVERVGEQLESLQVRLQQHLTELDGFDMARSITQLRQQEASYEAALMVTARLGRLSLLDWLR